MNHLKPTFWIWKLWRIKPTELWIRNALWELIKRLSIGIMEEMSTTITPRRKNNMGKIQKTTKHSKSAIHSTNLLHTLWYLFLMLLVTVSILFAKDGNHNECAQIQFYTLSTFNFSCAPVQCGLSIVHAFEKRANPV